MPLPVAPPSVVPAAVASFFADIETTAADHNANKAPKESPALTGEPTAPSYRATGKTGATTSPGILAGGTNTGAAPTTGPHVVGELVIGHDGKLWICTVAGTPGTWVRAGSVATDVLFDAKGDLPVGTGADTAARLPVGTNGQVLTADSTTATGMKWAAAAGGGGSVKAVTATRTSGNLSLTNTTWGNLDIGLDLTAPAVAGDKIVVAISGLWDNAAGSPLALIGAGTLVGGNLVSFFGSGEPTTDTGFGVPGWFGQAATAVGPTGESMPLTLASGDISGGNVTVRFRCRIGAAGTRVLNATTTIPLSVSLKNLGQ